MRHKVSECVKCGISSVYSKSFCRSCYEKNLRYENSDFANKQLQNRINWGLENKEKIKDATKKRQTDPYCIERDKKTHKKLALKKVGLSIESYKLLLEYQDEKCAICNKELTSTSCHLDHNYETHEARGYLYNGCNRGLGMFGDCVEGLVKAILYLKNPTATKFVDKSIIPEYVKERKKNGRKF